MRPWNIKCDQERIGTNEDVTATFFRGTPTGFVGVLHLVFSAGEWSGDQVHFAPSAKDPNTPGQSCRRSCSVGCDAQQREAELVKREASDLTDRSNTKKKSRQKANGKIPAEQSADYGVR